MISRSPRFFFGDGSWLFVAVAGLSFSPACHKDEPQAQVAESPLTRLSPQQYENTVADLLDVRSFPNKGLLSEPTDRAGVSTHPSVSVLDLRNYLADAEVVAQATRGSGTLVQLAPCASTTAQDPTQAGGCAETFIRSFGAKLYRRALSDDEVADLRKSYDQAVLANAAGGLGLDYLGGIQFLLEAMLNEPQFLYLFEEGQAPEKPPAPGDVVPLSPSEIASRLAMFLWQSAPDAELLAAVADGRLATREGIAEQVERMLGAPGRPEPRARRVMENFAYRWLSLTDAAQVRKSPALYPTFDDETRAALPLETARFFSYVTFEDDGSLRTLLTAPYSFVNVPLARIYGLNNAHLDGQTLGKVALDSTQRGGFLTQPAFLAARAHSADSSPTLRGLFVRRQLLCEDLAPPPPSANTTPPPPDLSLPTRERYKDHSRNPLCASCHLRMDPVGAGFEKYDAAGGYQTFIGSYQIDGVGQMYYSKDLDGAFNGPLELAQKMLQSPTVEDCFVRQLFRFAMGRYEQSDGDAQSLEQTRVRFHDSGQDIRRLLAELTVSDAFRYRKLREGEGQP